MEYKDTWNLQPTKLFYIEYLNNTLLISMS